LREKYAEFGNKRIEIAAIDDNFASPTEKCDIYDYVGLSSDAIYKKMLEMIG
jgi:hypothetical protein